jgi:hypothetical protein
LLQLCFSVLNDRTDLWCVGLHEHFQEEINGFDLHDEVTDNRHSP